MVYILSLIMSCIVLIVIFLCFPSFTLWHSMVSYNVLDCLNIHLPLFPFLYSLALYGLYMVSYNVLDCLNSYLDTVDVKKMFTKSFTEHHFNHHSSDKET